MRTGRVRAAAAWSVGGALGPFVAQDITTADWRRARNADNNAADRVLVVAAVPGFLGQREIRGRMFNPVTETNASAQFDIELNILWDDLDPDVGGDPNPAGTSYFCVVWERVITLGLNRDIHARTVHPTSLALGALVLLTPGAAGDDQVRAAIDRLEAPPVEVIDVGVGDQDRVEPARGAGAAAAQRIDEHPAAVDLDRRGGVAMPRHAPGRAGHQGAGRRVAARSVAGERFGRGHGPAIARCLC